MKRRMSISAAIALTALTAWSFAQPASAQSFSCSNADQPAEFAICNNEELLVLDETLADRLTQKISSADTRPQQQLIERKFNNWLLKRNQCGTDFACLELRYRDVLSDI